MWKYKLYINFLRGPGARNPRFADENNREAVSQPMIIVIGYDTSRFKVVIRTDDYVLHNGLSSYYQTNFRTGLFPTVFYGDVTV